MTRVPPFREHAVPPLLDRGKVTLLTLGKTSAHFSKLSQRSDARASGGEERAADTSIIKRPGAHPSYFFEAEPHLVLGFFDAPGAHDNDGFGPGFRGTFEIVDNGFISKINNTVGIGVGLDWLFMGTIATATGTTSGAGMPTRSCFPSSCSGTSG